ncbi:hypothetical protein ACP70R_008196 [Stipagrostis hirtigluma subsp. patula]
MGEQLPETHRMPLSYVAQKQPYELLTSDTANPIIREIQLVKGEFDLGNRNRNWRAKSSFPARCFYPLEPRPHEDKANTLGNRIVSKGLGWENFSFAPISFPTGYEAWCADILNNHSFNLKGDGSGTDYLYGAIFCSLGKYTISPSLLKVLLERWNPDTNTFLFPMGERTITLLDMQKMAGLPVEGEMYDEFIPHGRHLEPSMLSYPKTLSTLLKTWESLRDGDRVSFEVWCNHFYNSPDILSQSSDGEASRLYTAAFLALWLCGFVVIGGGPYIRPSVLVVASWMAVGRRFALAQPALCSLYHSLRLISTDPVGPGSVHRAWPVHFVVSWMGVYMKKVFGEKARRVHIPTCKYPAVRPSMLNTMFRVPQHFTPETAHEFMCRDANILWYPYRPRSASQATKQPSLWISRAFYLSLRRGVLPWRRANFKEDFCILEPYHPDRVAQQFRLDQVVPYPPLASLLTSKDVGISYAHWMYLLNPGQPDLSIFPDDSRIGSPSLPWVKWFLSFIEPFNNILDNLTHGSAYGRISYNDRFESHHAEPKCPTRKLCSYDFVMVKPVSSEHKQRFATLVEARASAADGPWMRLLHSFWAGKTAPPIQSNLQQGSSSHRDCADGSSSHSLLIDNIPARDNLRDEQIDLPHKGSGKRQLSQVIQTKADVQPSAKKKLNFDDEAIACDSVTSPIPLDNVAATDTGLPSTPGFSELEESDDLGAYCISKNGGTSPQPLPFVMPPVNMGQLSGEQIPLLSSNCPVMPSISELGDDVVAPSLHDFEQQTAKTSCGEAIPAMDAFLEEAFLELARKILGKALEGLDVSTLREPARFAFLKTASARLPTEPASVLTVKAALDELASISSKLQEVYSQFDETLGQKEQAVDAAKNAVATQEAALNATVSEISIVEKQEADLSEELAKLNRALLDVKQKKDQLMQAHSAQDLELKKVRDSLQETTARFDQEAIDLEEKTKHFGPKVEKIISSLKNWRSGSE